MDRKVVDGWREPQVCQPPSWLTNLCMQKLFSSNF